MSLRSASFFVVLCSSLILSAGSVFAKTVVPTEAPALLKQINDNFIRQLGQSLSSKADTKSGLKIFDARCPYRFSDGILSTYLGAIQNRNMPLAAQLLSRIHAQLNCVSAARFRDILMSLQFALRHESLSKFPDDAKQFADQALTPLVLLLFDLGSAPLRHVLYPWLYVQLAKIESASVKSSAIASEIGLWVTSDYGLRKLDLENIRQLSDILTSSALASGRCKIVDVQIVPVKGIEPGIPYCLKDCLAVEGDAATLKLNGKPINEITRLCDRKRDQKKALLDSPARSKIRQCQSEFGGRNQRFTSCIIDKGIAEQRRVFGILDLEESLPTKEELAVRRRCNLSQGASGANPKPQYLILTRDGKKTKSWLRLTTLDKNGKAIEITTITTEYNNGKKSTQTTITETQEGATETVFEYAGDESIVTQNVYNNNGTMSSDEPLVIPIDEDDKNSTVWVGPPTVPPSNESCGPEQDTCADNCSIEDQRLSDIRECMAILEGKEEDGKGEERPKFEPDPRILMPDAQTVGALKPEIARLNQCLLQAIGVTDENKIVTQNDCQAYVQCADFYSLPGKECNCKGDPESNVDPDGKVTAELCNLVLCESEKGVCPCDELKLGGSDRPGGILPGTGPSPDPSPVMRLKILGMPYSP